MKHAAARPATKPAASSSQRRTALYRQVPYVRHTCCRICDAPLPKPVIKLPRFPLSEIYVPRKPAEPVGFLDQAICLCERCGHGQIVRTIPPEVLYDSHYFTRTAGSTAQRAVDDFLSFALPHLPKRRLKSVLEVGCNDLYLLEKIADRADSLCGIDPIWRGREDQSTHPKIRVIGDFFENVSPDRLGGSPDVIFSSHTLEHIDDPRRLFATLLGRAGRDTLFCFQFPGFEPLVRDGRFDQLHHQHLNYFTLASVCAALERTGGELLDFAYNPNHWGALMIVFRKARASRAASHRRLLRRYHPLTTAEVRTRYATFRASCVALDAEIRALAQHRPLYGYGAALMLPLLAYHIPAIAHLKAIIDDDPHKQGLYYLNLPLRIVPSTAVADLAHAAVVVTAINSKASVRGITRKLIEHDVRDIVLPTHLL